MMFKEAVAPALVGNFLDFRKDSGLVTAKDESLTS